MAIIDCPSCHKKVSDKAAKCQHCGLDLKNVDEQKLQHIRQVERIEKSQRMMTFSFVAMLLFCGGFLFLYWFEAKPGTLTYLSSMLAIAVGFVLYIVTRVRIIFLKRSGK